MLFNPNDRFQVKISHGITKPKNFVSWIKDRIKDKSIQINFKFFEEGYIVDYLTEQDIESWSPKYPVILSAPTGSGKNHFIQTTLFQHVLKNQPKNTKSKNKILILSNRIALSRQGKHKLSEKVVEYTGDYGILERLQSLYTEEGTDRLCVDFGQVTVCSYHQLWDRKLLDNHHFKYIVCDECHFFTNDATFNANTDAILRYIIDNGQNSIRIYMSATIETVFEPLIREEFKSTENSISNEEFKHNSFCNDPVNHMNMDQARVGLPYYMSNSEVYANNISKKMNRYREANTFQIWFYYMHRSYPLIENVYHFFYMNEITTKILADKDRSHKWLVFVSDNQTGERLAADFSRNDRKSTFISRKRVETMQDIKKVYDAIISNEYFKDDVLVSTSILDNGINLHKTPNGDIIHGVVIDSFNHDQFIQMLGRVRDQKFSIFVRHYTKSELEKKAVRLLDDIIKRLRIDQADIETKKKVFDKDLFRFTSDEDGFCTYNALAIFQLCSLMTPILRCLKENMEDPIEIKCSSIELEACRVKALEYYTHGNGTYNPYSEMIVNTLSCNYEHYSATMGSTTDFIYELCAKYNEDKIQEKIDLLLKIDTYSSQEFEWGNIEHDYLAQDSAFDKLTRLIDILQKNKNLSISLPEEVCDTYIDLYEYYFTSLPDIRIESQNVQMEWLMKPHDTSKRVETLKDTKD